MNVRAKLLGAAGSVTGSRHFLEIDDFKVLVDCGLFQGLKELRLLNWDKFPVDPEEIDAIVITHAHIDQPYRLFAQAGKRGIFWADLLYGSYHGANQDTPIG